MKHERRKTALSGRTSVVLPSFVRRGLRGGRSRAFFTVLLLTLISAAFSPAVTGCSGGSAVTGADLVIGQKGTVYYIDDHLGSAQMLTDSESGVLYEGMSAPYGLDLDGVASDESAGDDGADYSYTTKEIDRETGLVYFGKRYYSPNMGRWITPDPLYIAEPSRLVKKTMEGNLYGYALNNPVSYFDPDGRDVFYAGVNAVEWIAEKPMEASYGAYGKLVEAGVAVDVKSYEWSELFKWSNYEITTYATLGSPDHFQPSSGADVSTGFTFGYLGQDTTFDDMQGSSMEYIGAISSQSFSETVTASGKNGISYSMSIGGGLGIAGFQNYTETNIDSFSRLGEVMIKKEYLELFQDVTTNE